MATASFRINDYSDESSSFRVTGVNLSAANIDAQETAAEALAAAVDGLTIGTLEYVAIQNEIQNTPGIPADPYAQRELKWLVTYQADVSGKSYSIEIACPDVTGNLAGNTDQANLASTDWSAFVTAFEAYAREPGNLAGLVTVTSARLVGRNI